MVINELDYGGFGVFFEIWKGILNLKKRVIFLKKVMNFFLFNINFIL